MILVALDTATLTASAAVLSGDEVLAEGDARASTHSEKLLPLIDALLRTAGVSPAALDAVACGAGPGSFTGLRIGLATAKGLCFALGKPLVLASSLAALALDAPAPPGALVLSLLDAKKHELYAGLYRHTPSGLLEEVCPEAVLPPDRLPDHVARAAAGARVVVVGDGAAAYPDAAARAGEVMHGARATPRAAQVARMGASRLAAGSHDDLLTAAPTYIRASEAEIATPPGERLK